MSPLLRGALLSKIMALPVKKIPLTAEEYLRIEREAPDKSEYYGGEIFSMAGGSPRHSLLAANILIALGKSLEGRRDTSYTSDLRIGIPGDDLYTHTDVSIFYEPMTFMAGTDDTAANPTAMIGRGADRFWESFPNFYRPSGPENRAATCGIRLGHNLSWGWASTRTEDAGSFPAQ